jgi:hypothetical protein
LKVAWGGTRCIICLEPGRLSEEHLVPASLGGILASEFVCKACNDRFGHGFEAVARQSPAIRIAAHNLKGDLPDLAKAIESKQAYIVRVPDPGLEFRTAAGLRARGRAPDGSLLVPAEDAPVVISQMMKRRGSGAQEVAQALSTLARLPVGQRASLGEEIEVVNWDQVSAQMDLSRGPTLSNLVPLKAAYEFASLLIGPAVYDIQPLDRIRKILFEQDDTAASDLVAFTYAGGYRPFHGLLFEGNAPEARLALRLFGRLAYRVTLPSIAIDAPAFSATMYLQSGEVDFIDHSAGEDDSRG